MFSQPAPKGLPTARKRNGLRNQSRLSSAGPQDSNYHTQNTLFGQDATQEVNPEGSKPNAFLGVGRIPPGSLRNRSVTPIGRIDASQAMNIPEE